MININPNYELLSKYLPNNISSRTDNKLLVVCYQEHLRKYIDNFDNRFYELIEDYDLHSFSPDLFIFCGYYNMTWHDTYFTYIKHDEEKKYKKERLKIEDVINRISSDKLKKEMRNGLKPFIKLAYLTDYNEYLQELKKNTNYFQFLKDDEAIPTEAEFNSWLGPTRKEHHIRKYFEGFKPLKLYFEQEIKNKEPRTIYDFIYNLCLLFEIDFTLITDTPIHYITNRLQ